METTYLITSLIPTNGQTTAYLTNTIKFDYDENGNDHDQKLFDIELFLRGQAGKPSFYSFKYLELETEVECEKERTRIKKEYNDIDKYTVVEISYPSKKGLKLSVEQKKDSMSASFEITLPNLSSINMIFDYNALYENIILVYDYNGALIRNSNNYFGDNSPLFTEQNKSGHDIKYTVLSQHKESAPDASNPFVNSWGTIVSQTDDQIIIGWRDRYQNYDFRNAIVTINLF